MNAISRVVDAITRTQAPQQRVWAFVWSRINRPKNLFQFAGILACMAVYVGDLQEVVDTDPNDPAGLVIKDHGLVSRLLSWSSIDPAVFSGTGFISFVFVVFVASLIFVTHTGTRNSKLTPILVTVQILAGVLVNNDLLLIVAAQLPLIFRLPRALLWLFLQTVGIMVAWTVVLISTDLPTQDVTQSSSRDEFAMMVGVSMLMFIAWQSFAFCLGYIAMSERQGRNKLAVANAQLRATRQLLAESERSDERLRISRELHDSLGHHLTALRIHLELAGRQGADKQASSVQTASKIASELLTEIRAVVSSEREEYPVDLKQSLITMCEGLPSIEVSIECGADCKFSNTAQAHVAFRCIQEAVSNTLRHADASRSSIEICRIEGGLQVTVSDNGRGVSEVIAGNGLTGMCERLEACGGRLETHSIVDQGFIVTFWIPLHDAREVV
ncbi:MAG: sensor histidine kinase [Pseudohongiella sp.]|nr:sensor histidine kinase [Pseudohongiella sp.]